MLFLLSFLTYSVIQKLPNQIIDSTFIMSSSKSLKRRTATRESIGLGKPYSLGVYKKLDLMLSFLYFFDICKYFFCPDWVLIGECSNYLIYLFANLFL